MKLNLSKQWFETHLPAEDGHEIGAGGPADVGEPIERYRRWQWSVTLSTWALPLCVTKYHCGAMTLQFLCFELHTDMAHRWPTENREPPLGPS